MATATLHEDTFPAAVGGGANDVLAGSAPIWYVSFSSLVKWDRSTNQYSIWPLPSHGSAHGGFITRDSLGQIWYTQGVTTAGGADNYLGVLRGDNTIKEWQIPTTSADPRTISMNTLTQQ